MKFLYYDIGFLIIFGLFLFWFLYKRRKNLKREGVIYLYRTNVGLKVIDYIGKKFKKTLNFLSYFSVACGYVLMALMIYLLVHLVWIFSKPEFVKAIKIPPLMPLIPYIPSVFKLDFLPPFYFTYWIIAIAVIAISHEFAHGIFARLYNIKVKSTGFGFLGPFLAAFVEPDEKQMSKKGVFQQLSVLTAGSFANVIMTVLFFAIMLLFFTAAYAPAGAVFTDYTYSFIPFSMINSSVIGNETIAVNEVNLVQININNTDYFIPEEILSEEFEKPEEVFVKGYWDFPAIRAGLKGTIIGINGKEIKTRQDLSDVFSELNPGDKINIQTRVGNEIENYEIVLEESPVEEGNPFLGIGFIGGRQGVIGSMIKLFSFFRQEGTEYLPKFGGNNGNIIIFIYNLLWWIVLINISVALFNMLPVGIFDGGRVFYLTILYITKSKEKSKMAFKIVTWIILLIFILLMLFWIVGIQ